MTPSACRPLVLVLQGAGYGQQAPLLWWTRSIADQHRAEVIAPDWTVDELARADPVAFVEDAVTDALGGRTPDLVVAKSFGCFALPWAVRNGIDGVWLTPVLTRPEVLGALLTAGDGSVAVGGGADALWEPSRTATTNARLVTIAGADHALEVPGDWRRSQRLQSEILDLVDARITALVR
ncbi:hypothetical protein [Curtobacterium sp. ISL-83]|uniref:hypothetical protein n=1 Tax=Curtobacterium sp. ISL-83 TaxID=2819145 RepID=UPI001BE68E67|nr:hypothetical protein [Curtobacterium sp. ISL-83]MBT2501406.1 hypothetical protein [Curtobacterium sp. ISL-83]